MSLSAPDPLFQAFERLTPAEIAASIDAATAPFDHAGEARPLVIVGSGVLGRRMWHIAKRAGLTVLAFADNDPTSWRAGDSDSPAVIAPEAAVEKYNGVAAFVIGIFNSRRPRAQLVSLGASHIATYAAFCLRFWEAVPRFIGFDKPEAILERRDDIWRAYSTLADDYSRAEFAAQIVWRCTLDYSVLPPPEDGRKTYFDPNVFRLRHDDVLVDCGAYDGDTLRAFLELSEGRFSFAYACEPDPANRIKLQRYVDSLSVATRSRITVLPYAVGADDAVVRFKSGDGVGSSVDQEARLEVEGRRLDTILTHVPTLIKMDIEGAEPDALVGASRALSAGRAVLAVSAYHYPEHLWELPAIVRSLAPDHFVFLRRYAEECWELVYYAVPRERMLL